MDSLAPSAAAAPAGSDPSHNRSFDNHRKSSYNNLVVLANAQEVWNNLSLENGKKLLWRDHGAPPVVIETIQDCIKHSAMGGLRAATLAYGIRAGISLFLALARVLRYPKHFRFTLLRHALFGNHEARHFGAMIGTFTALYKLLLNVLPILHHRWEESRPPLPRTFTDLEAADEGYVMHRRMVDKSKRPTPTVLLDDRALSASPLPLADASTPTSLSRQSTPLPPHLSSATTASLAAARRRGYEFEPWQAAVAGSLAAGVAILLERPSNRTGVGQQMFVRGLQGVYNAWSKRTGIVVPFGSVWVFSICSAQILYAYLLKPHSLPPPYNAWIQSMSMAPAESLRIIRSLALTGSYEPALLEKIIDGKSRWTGFNTTITHRNRTGLLEELARVKQGVFPIAPSCAVIHPHHTRCVPNAIIRIVECARLLLPVYGALHLIPTLLFKRKALLENPLHAALKVILGTVRSSTFIGVFVFVIQSGTCILRNLSLANLPKPMAALVRAMARSKFAYWLYCSLCGLSLFVEDKYRREELAMYVLPKAGESAWVLFREEVLGWGTRRKGAWKGDVALSSVGMGMVMTIYQTNPAALSGLVRRILYQFVGPN